MTQPPITSDGPARLAGPRSLLADSRWVDGDERLSLSVTGQDEDRLLVVAQASYDGEFNAPVLVLLDRGQAAWLVGELQRALADWEVTP